MFLYLICSVIVLCVLHLALNYNKRARMIKKIPGPKMDFLFGDGLNIMQSRVGIMTMVKNYANMWNGIWSLWVFPYASVFIYNHKDIELILSGTKYTDKSVIYSLFQSWLQEGLLVSNGAKWQERRKILTPAFHFNVLKENYEVLKINSERFVKNVQEIAGKPVDVVPMLSEFTLNSICETAMGIPLSEDNTKEAKSYKQAVYALGLIFYKRLLRPYLYSDFIFNLSYWGRKQAHHLKALHSFTESVVEKRKEYILKNGINVNELIEDEAYFYTKKKKTAMLDLLISAEMEGLIDKKGIQEEVDTFMFEGHDTTASGLSFCLMIIANHREVQNKIRDEINEIFGDTKYPIKMEDINKLIYLDRCIKESLRMYPPVHLISRALNEQTVLSNYTVPAGTLCHISILDLHYREDIYKNPKQFDPDRFLPENCATRPPYAYIPFSAGPRNCIGQKFAMMEMKMVVIKVLQEFDLVPVTRPEDIRMTADIVLRHDGPILVQFEQRKQ